MLPSLIQMPNEYGLVPHITFGLKFTNTWKKLYNTSKKLSYLHIKLLDMEYIISLLLLLFQELHYSTFMMKDK